MFNTIFTVIQMNSQVLLHENILNHQYLIKSALEQHVYFELNMTFKLLTQFIPPCNYF